MKKVALILALLLFSFNNFAKSDVISEKLINKDKIKVELSTENEQSGPLRYSYLTSCGVTAVSYSYEQVSLDAYIAWGEAMEEWYCEEL